MSSFLKRILSVTTALATAAAAAVAQGGAADSTGVVVRGTVSNDAGAPLSGVNVFLQGLNIGTQTGGDGRYTFNVGASHATGQPATLIARVLGYTPKTVQITLTPGTTITQNFALAANPLRLGQVVVTGAGTSTIRERLTTTINTVDTSILRRAATPQNVVSALSGAAPNVEVRTQSGDPGASASIKIRGASSLTGTGQPLFVVDGQPIDNATEATTPAGSAQAALQGTVAPNRASDINPNDIESIEILKGSAAAAIYGARAANGVVLITTKRGHAGPTRYTFSSTETFDNVQSNVPLQRIYGQGTGGNPITSGCGTTSANCFNGSWGPLLPAGTPTYDHESEIFKTGLTADNNLSVSGGNDRTTFYASGGLLNQDGVVVGPNNKYNRASVRLKGTQQVSNTFTLGGNFSYIDTRGAFVEKGTAASGLLLGALRTPPDFNNSPYLDPISGLQRSYRFPNPTSASLTLTRGYDNPFFTAYVPVARSELGRSISDVNVDWVPFAWLSVKYTLGGDYYSDWRIEALPFTASSDPQGRVIRNDLNNLEIDHNLIATATKELNDHVTGTLTVGQNLNSRRNRETYILGDHLNAPQPYAIQNTINVSVAESRYLAHIQAYFVQGELDLYNQLYLVAGVRNDGFSTFGASKRTAFYPKASMAWNFTNALGNMEQKGLLSYGKLRLAYGETGKEPPFYAATNTLTNVEPFSSGYGDFLNTNQSGQGGLTQNPIVGNPALRPERSRESELGADLGFFDQRADLSATVYDKRSTEVILPVTVNASQTGAFQAFENAAAITNTGVELSLNVRPYTTKNVAWDLGIMYARNKGSVLSLAGTQSIGLNNNAEGFLGAAGSATVGYAPGVIRGRDFIRCGRGLQADVGLGGSMSVDSLCRASSGGQLVSGALFLGTNGQPLLDPTDRVIADPNPRYTMSYNTSLKLYNNWRLSALLDLRKGGQVWDGTRAALYRFGTAAFTTIRSTTDAKFGQNFYTDIYPDVTGPGVGVVAFPNAAAWQAWFTSLGGLNGPQEQFVEDGSFVKLRELSLTYTLDQPFMRRFSGFSSADVRIAGRNLHTWTKYKGLDPEANLAGAQSLTQGIDFFNDPQTRSLVLSVSLNR